MALHSGAGRGPGHLNRESQGAGAAYAPKVLGAPGFPAGSSSATSTVS